MWVLAKLSACTAASTHWSLNDCTIFIKHLMSWLFFYKADSIIIESCHSYIIFEAALEILFLIAYA